jgi:hypothetical protein
MSWTKRQYITQAFRAIGLAEYVFDLDASELQDALYALDALMGTWNAMGMKLSYPLPSSPDLADLDEVTSVPDKANEAIFTNLALRIAPGYGKSVSLELKQAAYLSYQTLIKMFSVPHNMQLPQDMPLGAGNKLLPDEQFTDTPADIEQPWDEPID